MCTINETKKVFKGKIYVCDIVLILISSWSNQHTPFSMISKETHGIVSMYTCKLILCKLRQSNVCTTLGRGEICLEMHIIRCTTISVNVTSPFLLSLASLLVRNTKNKGHKCPPNSVLPRGKNSNLEPNLDIENANPNFRDKQKDFRLDLMGTLWHFIKIEHASNLMHFWT